MDRTETVLQAIERQSADPTAFLPIVGRKKGKLLEDLVREHRPERVLEIGTLVGYSAILMARNLPSAGKITSLEISPELAAVARQNIRAAGFAEVVEVVVGDALKLIPQLGGRFDFVFIDAAKEEYLAYLKLLETGGRLEDGCVIVADNAKIFAQQMADYLAYVRNDPSYESEFHDFGDDGMEVSVRPGHRRRDNTTAPRPG